METKLRRAYEKPHVQRFGTFRDITRDGLGAGLRGGLTLSPDANTGPGDLLTVLRESR